MSDPTPELPDVYFRTIDGKIDWAEDCCSPDAGDVLMGHDEASTGTVDTVRYVPAERAEALRTKLAKALMDIAAIRQLVGPAP